MAVSVARLPGVRFASQPPLLSGALPRMDVAVFVGFAAAGPLHQPVVVEGPAQFAEVFGQDLPLAWDPLRGQLANAYLGPCVRAFFGNGGRRCWVVRVAETTATLAVARRLGWPVTRPAAQANGFPLRGLVGLDQAKGTWSQATTAARSEGSWSDGLRVGTGLLSEPVHLIAPPQAPAGGLSLTVSTPTDLEPGDLVRLTLPASGHVVYLELDAVTPTPTGRQPVWFSTHLDPAQAASASGARLFGAAGQPVELPLLAASVDPGTGWLELQVLVDPAALPDIGALVQVDLSGGPARTAWLVVGLAEPGEAYGSPLAGQVRLAGQAVGWLAQPPDPLPSFGGGWAERLSLELETRLAFERWPGQAQAYPMRLDDLGLGAAHPRFWGSLPTDTLLYAPQDESLLRNMPQLTGLWQTVSTPRFPLAGAPLPGRRYLPLGVGNATDPAALSAPVLGSLSPLERDGLSGFGADLFIDRELAGVGVRALLGEADFLRYQQPLPRPLSGIHATLSLDEPSLIAVPDAVQRGWVHVASSAPPPTVPAAAPVALSVPGQFGACDAVAAPALLPITPPTAATYQVRWMADAPPEAVYVLQESPVSDFADPVVVFRGSAELAAIDGRADGVYFYRVRAELGTAVSPWSNVQAVRVGGSVGWQLLAPDQLSLDTLREVHQHLLGLSAAAGDRLAILSLPAHLREDAALTYVATLQASPLDDPDRTLSFGAVYHPWPVGPDTVAGDLRPVPPDGVMAGSIAARTLDRGAWVAPANAAFQGVLALQPPLAPSRWLDLQSGQINILRQDPSGFLTLSASTLSGDPTLEPINVRRLLSLLRRLVLREGPAYVFEPNDASFRRLVERGFDAVLDDLFQRGAFAGATPATSFQVNTAGGLNTPQDNDAGRFIVELKVAPSLPLAFLTVRLVETNDRGLVVTEG